MFFVSLRVISRRDPNSDKGKRKSFLVWVDTTSSLEAEDMARELAVEQQLEIQILEASSETTRDDYFAPCPSLDAYDRAQREGVAFRLVSL